MGQRAEAGMWESRELKVVWEPEHRWTPSVEPRPGRWAVFSSEGKEAGVLETDDVAWVGFVGAGGETDLNVYASGLIQTFKNFDYSARTAFELTRGLVELEYGVTSKIVYGQLSRRDEERR